MRSPSTQVTPLKGESLLILVDYDLFGTNVIDHTGIFIKSDNNTGKYLVYFPELQEWGEFAKESVSRTSPGTITSENEEIISLIKTLEYTYG